MLPAKIAKLVVFSGKTIASGSVIAPLTKHNVEIVKIAGRSIGNGLIHLKAESA